MTTIKSSSSAYSTTRSTSPSRVTVASNDVMVGFDDDLLAIKEHLCGTSSRRQVIPIVGMGGIGKTTLASNAYHDPLTQAQFHFGGWVTVSQSYSLEDILSRLEQSIKPFDANRVEEKTDVSEQEKDESKAEAEVSEQNNNCEEEISEQGNGTEDSEVELESSDPGLGPAKVFEQGPDSTGDKIYKKLKGRKYLVVMDDIWNTEVFDRLNRLFPDDNNGSRVILTTRLQDVATYAKDCSPHEMQLMHEDQSWNLLKQKVFIDGVCNEELQDIGMEIARSCGGLPLAVVTIAGLLATVVKTRAAWEEIAEKVSSTVAAKDSRFERILSLSYTHLPHRLRKCFVYMGGFPEDREIHVAKLIKLWIAEGFIDASTASKCLEEEAVEYLQDLIKRSLVLVGERKPHGEIKSCSLHDLMRDLCIQKADEEKFPIHDIDINSTLVERFKLGSLEDVKSFRVIDVGKDVLNPSPDGPELYPQISEQMFRLSNLRYLALAYFAEIPAAMSRLENLQTFIVYPMESLVRLPREVWEMPQLRHLVSSFDPLPDPEGEATPINLQTLWEVNNLEFTDMFVKMIPNVKKLGLVYSQRYELQQEYHLSNFLSLHQSGDLLDHYDYHLENLANLHQLEKLKMRVYPGFQGILNPVFPPSLRKLSLSGWRLPSWSDMKIIGSLPNLQVLKLKDSGGQDERWETAESEFTQLRFLLIERSDLREWITEREHFPRLKQLLFHYCHTLEAIPADIGEIPTLESIISRQDRSIYSVKIYSAGNESIFINHKTTNNGVDEGAEKVKHSFFHAQTRCSSKSVT